MEKDERLLPLPSGVSSNGNELQSAHQDYPTTYSPFYDDDAIDERRSIVEYFHVVYKRLPIILAMVILTTATVAFYMYRQPSIYYARSEMIVEQRKPKVQAEKAVFINYGNDANYYNTQLQLLQNPDLMREVVIRLNLQREPNLFGNPNKSFLAPVRSIFTTEKDSIGRESSLPVLTETSSEPTDFNQVILTPEEKNRVDLYAGVLLGGLKVDQVERTNLVNIMMTSTNPDIAAKVADKVGEVFIEQDFARETQGAKKTLEDLNNSIENLRTNIASQEQERVNYMSSNGILIRDDKGSDLPAQRLQTISANWLSAIDERRKIEALYGAAQKASGTGDILAVVGDNKAIQDARSQNLRRKSDSEKRNEEIDKQVQEAETEKARLLVKYTEEYAEVKQINKKIEALKANKEKVSKEVTDKNESEGKKLVKDAEREVLVGLQAQLQAAQKREAQLQNAYLQEVASANSQGIKETRLITLTREIQTNRGLLDTLTQRQKETELTIASSKPDNLSISSKAQRPIAPIGPQRNRNIFIAFLISLMAGIGLAFLLDYLDDSVRTSDDVGRHLGLPTLALIPHQSSVEKRKHGLLPTKSGTANSSTALISLEDNRSTMAEAYRHLRTSLLFSSAGKPPQTILITSSQPAEGKTTTAINTAITLAQAGADVVIIDCDLRRPRLHSHLGLANSNGLTNYLSGEKNPDNLIKSFAGLPKLKVITSGPIPPNPTELLSSNEMKNLLQYLKGNFKHVVIDSPPAISFTDAAILATLVDGVVLVAMAGKSSIHLIRRFKQRLGNIGARIYGVVLNGIKLNSMEYNYYGYGYTYNYYANPEDDESTPMMEEVIAAKDSIHQTKG